MKNKSCLTNLLDFIEKVGGHIDNGQLVDVIFLDFQKAFDKVPHQRLLLKVRALGIDGQILRWVEDWLSNRKQRVILNGSMSSWCSVVSGVPQGSVLGPLSFLVYINDIADCVTSNLLKFADDTKLFRAVTSAIDDDILRNDLIELCS